VIFQNPDIQEALVENMREMNDFHAKTARYRHLQKMAHVQIAQYFPDGGPDFLTLICR
jgi:hypothetical protein